MKKQLVMALCCLPILSAVFSLALLPAIENQPSISSEIEQKMELKLEREIADRAESKLADANKTSEISKERLNTDQLVQNAFFGWSSSGESYTTTHTGAWHFFTSISGTGNHLFLEDGSGWKIDAANARTVLLWTNSDIILIIPAPFYSFYDYLLVNYNTGDQVYADLKEKPAEFNPFSLWITEIGDDSLTLSDKTVWKIHSNHDLSILNTWKVGQKITIGINKSWFTSKKSPNLLIGLEKEMKGYIRAECEY